jgi:hypothetical protein
MGLTTIESWDLQQPEQLGDVQAITIGPRCTSGEIQRPDLSNEFVYREPDNGNHGENKAVKKIM